jgi:glutamyl-tRNA reductase
MLPAPPESQSLGDTSADHCLVAITISHRAAPVEVRERLARLEIDWGEHLRQSVPNLAEWALLSTCHRFELFVVVDDPVNTVESLRALLAELTGTAEAEVPGVLNFYSVHLDETAAQHLCRVAAGIDSAVLGEPQILGQVAQCYSNGVEEGGIGPVLSILFRTALRAGKRARNETRISAQSANLSSVALNHAVAWVGSLDQANVVVIGAGEMSRLALKALHARGAPHVVVVNRTLATAQAALLDARWQAASLNELDTRLATADIVFSATRAEGFMVSADAVAGSRRARSAAVSQARGPALIDLAVPRDIDPAVRALPGVCLIDVDDLHESLDRTRAQRALAVPQVEAILGEELDQYRAELRELAVRPVVVELRQKAELMRAQEVERTLRFLGPVDEGTRAHIHHLSRALVNKLLHAPTVRLKQMSHTEDAAQVADTIRILFALDHQTVLPPTPQHGAARGESSLG